MANELQQVLNNIKKDKDTNLKPENLKTGITCLGIEGTMDSGIDTSDATATANDILSGKTAYSKGEKLTGVFNGAKLFSSVEEMNLDTSAEVGDLGLVYADNTLTGIYEVRSKTDAAYPKFVDVTNVTFTGNDVTVTTQDYDKTVNRANIDALYEQIQAELDGPYQYHFENVGYDMDDNLVITVMLDEDRSPNGCRDFIYDEDGTFLGMGTPINSNYLSTAPEYTLDVFTINTNDWTYTKRRATNLGYRKTTSRGSVYVVVFDFQFKTFPYISMKNGLSVAGSATGSGKMRVVKLGTIDDYSAKIFYDNSYVNMPTWVPLSTQLTLTDKSDLGNGMIALGSQEVIVGDNTDIIKYFTSVENMNAYSPTENDKCVVVENDFATLYIPEKTNDFYFTSVPSIVRKTSSSNYYAKSIYTKSTEEDALALQKIYSLLYTNKNDLHLDGVCNFMITKVDANNWELHFGQDTQKYGDTIMPIICINGRGVWATIDSGTSSSNKLPFTISINLTDNSYNRINHGRNEDIENNGAGSTLYRRYLGYKFDTSDIFFMVTTDSLVENGTFKIVNSYKGLYYNNTIYDFYTGRNTVSVSSVYKWKQALENIMTPTKYNTALETSKQILGVKEEVQ